MFVDSNHTKLYFCNIMEKHLPFSGTHRTDSIKIHNIARAEKNIFLESGKTFTQLLFVFMYINKVRISLYIPTFLGKESPKVHTFQTMLNTIKSFLQTLTAVIARVTTVTNTSKCSISLSVACSSIHTRIGWKAWIICKI